MFQGRSMGFDHRGNLLFYAGSRYWDWLDWIGGAHAVFGLRFISHAGDLFSPGILWLGKKK